MATYKTTVTNGVSIGTTYTVVTADDTAGTLTIDFGTPYYLSGVVQITRSNVVVGGDAVITYPAAGKITIADGSTYKLTANDVIRIVANRITTPA